MMRSVMAAGVLAALTAACSGGDGNTVAANAAITNFTPPTTTSRAEYGGLIERRFRRSDANGDGKIAAAEMPGRRGERALARFDKNGDGFLDSTEWGDMMLARFDRLDANKDGSVTSEEREASRGDRAGRGDRAERRERRRERREAEAATENAI